MREKQRMFHGTKRAQEQHVYSFTARPSSAPLDPEARGKTAMGAYKAVENARRRASVHAESLRPGSTLLPRPPPPPRSESALSVRSVPFFLFAF